MFPGLGDPRFRGIFREACTIFIGMDDRLIPLYLVYLNRDGSMISCTSVSSNMILTPGDSEISKKALVEEHSQNPILVRLLQSFWLYSALSIILQEDSPPSYTVSETPLAGPSNLEHLERSVPNAQPCNFESISRRDSSIKGTWLLDPMLSIPSEFLPPLPQGESESTRKNLSLQTRDGSINADIFVLLTTAEELQKMENRMSLRTLIDTYTKDGHVTIKMVGSGLRSILWFFLYSSFFRSMK